MLQSKKVCIFVDGENLRHTIVDLFPREFDKRDYLPREAHWAEFFDWIAEEVAGQEADRIRTYWYVVNHVDFYPYRLNIARKEGSLQKVLLKNPDYAQKISAAVGTARDQLIEDMASELEERQQVMEKRFNGWASIQDTIADKNMAVEFRRAGYIRYDLFTKQLGSEKAVDVKLATDLIKFKDIYDIAVIVSGDQDYVPAVEAIKDYGKRTVNVSFLAENGNVLPGGAKRLNQATDWRLEIKHTDSKKHLGL